VVVIITDALCGSSACRKSRVEMTQSARRQIIRCIGRLDTKLKSVPHHSVLTSAQRVPAESNIDDSARDVGADIAALDY
jgi:hypothetical protein